MMPLLMSSIEALQRRETLWTGLKNECLMPIRITWHAKSLMQRQTIKFFS